MLNIIREGAELKNHRLRTIEAVIRCHLGGPSAYVVMKKTVDSTLGIYAVTKNIEGFTGADQQGR